MNLPAMGALIFDALCEHPYGLTTREVIEAAYPDPDREPDCAAGCIHAAVQRLNRKFVLRREWFRISRTSPARYAIFIRRPPV